MINALGLLEVEGMVAAMTLRMPMLKAANVRLLVMKCSTGRLTLVVEATWRPAAPRWMPGLPLPGGPAARSAVGKSAARKRIPSG